MVRSANVDTGENPLTKSPVMGITEPYVFSNSRLRPVLDPGKITP